MVIGVGDIDMTGGVDKNSGRAVECGGHRSGVVDKEPGGSVFAGDGGNRAAGVYAAYAVVAGVGDIDIAAAGIDGGWAVEFSACRQGPIAGKPGGIDAGDSADDASGADFAYAIIAGIGDIDCTGAIDKDACGGVEGGAGGGGGVTGKPGSARTGKGGD